MKFIRVYFCRPGDRLNTVRFDEKENEIYNALLSNDKASKQWKTQNEREEKIERDTETESNRMNKQPTK